MERKDMTGVIARCLNGDSQAQEELVLATQKRVYYHAKKLLKNEDHALDLTQDVLIAMLTKLDTLQKPEFFWTWLGGITSNLCNNALRASKRKVQEVQFIEDEDGNSTQETYETLDEQTIPDKAIDNDETRRMIVELVDDLPDAQRQCVLLYYYDEMSVKDIAGTLGVSENTIKSRLNYARKSIKEGVERYEKQGIKLYGMSPLPFLLFFLGRDAEMCGMTTEQAKQMVMQVMQKASITAAGTGVAATAANAAAGGSAAGTASGGTIATSTKAATAAAGKGLFGLSTKALAGTLAGLVLAGGITGGMLLRGDKDSNSFPMDYVAPPAWVEESFDRVEEFMSPEVSVGEVNDYTDSQGNPFRICWYTVQQGQPYFAAYASPESTQLTEAHVRTCPGVSPAVYWENISLGDSFLTVLDKLGIDSIPVDEDYDRMYVTCYCYTDAPEESEYSYTHMSPDMQTETDQWIALYHYEMGGSRYTGSLILLQFEDEILDSFHYQRKSPAPPEEESEGLPEQTTDGKASANSDSSGAGDTVGNGELNEPADLTSEASQEHSVLLEDVMDGPDAIRLAVDGTYVERELEICGQDAMSDVFWESTINGYRSVEPGTSFTVTNVGEDENAYINIWLSEYTKSKESKIIVATDDSDMEYSTHEVDVTGRYFTRGRGLFLTEESDGRPAGAGLNWWTDINGIVLWNDWDPMVRLYPGQSVTFRLPENETDALYNLVLGYIDPDDDLWMPPSKEIYVLMQPN